MDRKPKLQIYGLDACWQIRGCRTTVPELSRRVSGQFPYGRLDRSCSSQELPSKPTMSLRWSAVWKKITIKKKRRILDSSPSPSQAAPYDYDSYVQNFDEGYAQAEPENLSRSFSSRFAVPALILQTAGS